MFKPSRIRGRLERRPDPHHPGTTGNTAHPPSLRCAYRRSFRPNDLGCAHLNGRGRHARRYGGSRPATSIGSDVMRQRRLGNTGLEVAWLALGTMTWGRDTDPDDASAQLSAYLDAGGNFLDTADIYAGTESEKILGRLLGKSG